MKRLVLVLALVLLAGVVFAQDFEYESAVGWAKLATRGMSKPKVVPSHAPGMNWGLGYTDKRYFEPCGGR